MSAFGDALSGIFEKAAAGTRSLGIGASYYSRLSEVESSNDPNAKNASGAGGLFQFVPKTWAAYGTGSRFGLGDNVATAVSTLTKDNYGYLTGSLKRKPTEGELYLAHQQGAGNAAKLLANPNADAASIIGYDALTQNGGTYGMTAGEFASMWTSKFPGGAVNGVDNLHREMTPDEIAAGSHSGGILDFIGDWLTRIPIIILGFIFVAVGLAMFKPAQQVVTTVMKNGSKVLG
jgi:hypothetical protein